MRVIDDNFLLKIDSTLFAFYSNLFYRFGTLLKECDVSYRIGNKMATKMNRCIVDTSTLSELLKHNRTY